MLEDLAAGSVSRGAALFLYETTRHSPVRLALKLAEHFVGWTESKWSKD